MTTLLEAPISETKRTVRDAAHSLLAIIDSAKSLRPPGLNIALIPTHARLQTQDVKCVNHLVCALVLAQPEIAIESQASGLHRHKMLEILG